MTSSIEYQAPQYNVNPNDSRSLDHEETILGHLLAEKQYSLKDSLYYLTTYAKEETKAWDHTEAVSSAGFWVGFAAGGAAFLAVGAGPLGMAIGGVVAAIGSGGSWHLKDTAERVGSLRRTEFELHKNHPWLRDRLWQLSQQGATSAEIVAIYDRMLFHMFANGIPTDGNAIAGSMNLTAPVFADSPATSSAENQAQSGIQNENDQVMTRSETQSLAQTELQPSTVAGVAAAPSIVHSKVLCPIEVLGRDPYQSMGVIGGQRTGKTYTAALHTQNVKRKLGAKIIYINLMDAIGDAADDWPHADICITCHLRKLPQGKAQAMIEHVTSVVNDFFNDLNQILVFDEWVGFTSKSNQWIKKASQEASAAAIESKEAKTYIAPEGLGTSAIDLMNLVMAVTGELCQSGKKQAKAIWLLSPMVKAGSMEQQGLVIKEVQPMVVAISKDRSVSWTHPTTGQSQEIGFDDAGYRASIPNMGLPTIESIPKMDCTRMLYVKGTWYSLDNLPQLERTPTSAPEHRSPSPSIAPLSSEPTQKLGPGSQSWEYITQGTDREAIEVEASPTDEPWEVDEPIEVDAVEVPRTDNVVPFKSRQEHPLQDKLDRLYALLEGEDSITVKEIQKKLKLGSSLEAQQLAQIFCMKQKSSYRFGQKTNANGTVSYFIEAVA